MNKITKYNSKLAVFLFAHQDDEFAVYYLIDTLLKNGYEIVVFYLTSGTFSGQCSSVRNAESLHVLSKLALDASNIYFVGADNSIPDGQLCAHLEHAYAAVKNILRNYGKISLLYCPAWEGGHQDHDAAHLLGVFLAASYNILDDAFQFPLYGGRGLPWIFFRLFSCDPLNGPVLSYKISWPDRIRFLSLILLYRSQRKTFAGLFPFYLWHMLFRGTQKLQPVSLTRINSKPHQGQLLYERRKMYKYDDFACPVWIFINQHED
jgi:hypothetical protein